MVRARLRQRRKTRERAVELRVGHAVTTRDRRSKPAGVDPKRRPETLSFDELCGWPDGSPIHRLDI